MNNDLISRSALISAIEKGEGISWERYGDNEVCVRKKYIDNAPAVVPEMFMNSYQEGYDLAKREFERPKGEWIWKDDSAESHFLYCSSCGAGFYEPLALKTCPNCGAQMKEGAKND